MAGRSLRGSERAARLLLGFGVLLEVAMVVLPSPAAAGEPPTGADLVAEIDANPVIAGPGGAIAVDAVVVPKSAKG